MNSGALERIVVREVDAALVDRLAADLSIDPLASRILVCRGLVDETAIRTFFRPSLDRLHDPFLFSEMQTAVDRIMKAIAGNETIAVHGDYDVDGISSTALLVRVLRELGGRCFPRIPNRLTDGYGIVPDAVRSIAAEGARLMITVDCGVTAISEAALAASLGLDVIITDHHEPKKELPSALALLNPKADAGYPDRDLAGVGVALKLCQALGTATGRGPELWEKHLDLAALGTAADIVPLTGENRIIARFGLARMRTAPNPGLAALMEAQGVRGKPLTAGMVGFQIAPCINAAGRLGAATRGLDLLLTDDASVARSLAMELRTANIERRAIDAAVVREACAWVDRNCDPQRDSSIVAGSANWHPGVIGIVASKLVERYHRPAILFALGEGGQARGSGRSIPGLDLLSALNDCAELLVSFGGHAAAAGMSITSGAIDAFRTRFNEAVCARLRAEELVPVIMADAEVTLDALTPKLLSFIKQMEPFGAANQQPVLLCRGLTARGAPRVVGTNHLKFTAGADGVTMDAIAFNMANRMERVKAPATFALAFNLDENEWNGRITMQLKVKGITV